MEENKMIDNEKQLNLVFYDTESHGYIRVHKDTFFQFNLNGSEFSKCSYYSKGYFYLEEDCDATKFEKIVKDKGYSINYTNKYVNCFYFDNNKFQPNMEVK